MSLLLLFLLLLPLSSAQRVRCSSATVSGETAQEFSSLHNFADVMEVAAVFLCGRRGKTRPSATIFREKLPAWADTHTHTHTHTHKQASDPSFVVFCKCEPHVKQDAANTSHVGVFSSRSLFRTRQKEMLARLWKKRLRFYEQKREHFLHLCGVAGTSFFSFILTLFFESCHRY